MLTMLIGQITEASSPPENIDIYVCKERGEIIKAKL